MSDSYRFFDNTIYLWNPCIWKLKILRSSCFARHFEDPIFFAIGVGFDHRSNDLKIVRILYFVDFYMPICVERQPPKVEVYSMATNSWTRIGTSVGYYAINMLSTAYVNGAVHWIASETGEVCRLGNFALSFNFDSAEFGVIMLPKYHNEGVENGDGDSPQVSITVLRDSLVLIVCCFNNYEIKHCYIWVMREYGMAESWTNEYSIVPKGRFIRCLAIINNNDLLMETKGDRSEVVFYDLENHQFKHLGIGRNVYIRDLLNFLESLVVYHEGFRLTPRK